MTAKGQVNASSLCWHIDRSFCQQTLNIRKRNDAKWLVWSTRICSKISSHPETGSFSVVFCAHSTLKVAKEEELDKICVCESEANFPLRKPRCTTCARAACFLACTDLVFCQMIKLLSAPNKTRIFTKCCVTHESGTAEIPAHAFVYTKPETIMKKFLNFSNFFIAKMCEIPTRMDIFLDSE